MVKDMPSIDRNSKPIQIQNSPAYFYGGSEFFISGSGSEILPDTMWYADGNLLTVSPTSASGLFHEIFQIEKSFEKQFSELYQDKTEKEYDRIRVKMQLSLSYAMSLSPFRISLQLTSHSLYYTLIFPGTTLYFEHYYDQISDDMDEALIGIYEDGTNVLNYGGSLNKAFAKAFQYFQQKSKITRGEYGVSYGNLTQI